MVTQEEITAIYDLWDRETNGAPLPDSIKDHITGSMDNDLDEARIRLQQIQAERGGYLTESDFKGFPEVLRGEFNIKSDEEMSPNTTQTTQAKQAITAALDTKFQITQADAPRTPAYREMERAAQADYERLYAENLNDGLTPAQAHEKANGS